METPLRLLRARTLERLVKASRERDRREILDAVRRVGADLVVVALSPSMARRLCASHAADGPHGLRAPTIVDVSLGFMEWKVHVRRTAAAGGCRAG